MASRTGRSPWGPETEPTCPEKHPHNTWCYTDHKCRCRECRAAWATATRKRYHKRARYEHRQPAVAGAGPVVRMLRALAVMGYSGAEVAELTGLNRPNLNCIRRGSHPTVKVETARKIVRLYRERWTIPSKNPQAKYVATRARKAGYHSPLYWADIEKGIVDDED